MGGGEHFRLELGDLVVVVPSGRSRSGDPPPEAHRRPRRSGPARVRGRPRAVQERALAGWKRDPSYQRVTDGIGALDAWLAPIPGVGDPVRENGRKSSDRGIEIVLDDLGRSCISRADAKTLFIEQREGEARKREMLDRNEQRAIEQDRLRRALIWRGLPAVDLPYGVSASSAMLQAARDAQPKRMGVLQEALAGESMTYHPIAPNGDES